MAKSKIKYAMRNRSFKLYLDKEAQAVETFKKEMLDLDKIYKAILAKEKAMIKV